MADGKTGKTLNLTEGNPLKLILLFAIPVFFGKTVPDDVQSDRYQDRRKYFRGRGIGGSWLRVDPL